MFLLHSATVQGSKTCDDLVHCCEMMVRGGAENDGLVAFGHVGWGNDDGLYLICSSMSMKRINKFALMHA